MYRVSSDLENICGKEDNKKMVDTVSPSWGSHKKDQRIFNFSNVIKGGVTGL